MFLEKPVFGWGLRAFTNVSPFATYSHNNYIEVLVTWGIVGFIWYYLFLLVITVKGIILQFSKNCTKFVAFSIAILIVLFVNDLSTVYLKDEVTHFFYALCFAIVASHTPPSGIDVVTVLLNIKKWVSRLGHPSRN